MARKELLWGGSVGGKGGTVVGASVVGIAVVGDKVVLGIVAASGVGDNVVGAKVVSGIVDVPSVGKQTGFPHSLQVRPRKLEPQNSMLAVFVTGSRHGKISVGQLLLRQQLHWDHVASPHAVVASSEKSPQAKALLWNLAS